MTNQKHTPGPWGCYVEEAGRDHLSARSAYVINSESENRYPKHYENQANAHLIATAPDMLELLKSLWELRGQINHDSIIWKEVKQVITKAEGE